MSLPNQKDFSFILLHKVDSTNNYAMGLVHAAMAQHGTAVFAREQTRGRGQWNREWISESMNNIALSIILHVEDRISPSRMFLLSKAIALALSDFFKSLGFDPAIKWPNDIYLNDRKAAGVLIENVLKGSSWKYAIVGVGINVNQVNFGELAKKAVSLKQLSGKTYDPEQLARNLHLKLLEYFDLALLNPEKIHTDYDELLYRKNNKVKLKKDARIFEALVKGVNEFGELVVDHGMEEKFSVGEVEWMN